MAGIRKMMLVFRVPGWVFWILRLALAVVFIYAGVSKLIAPLRFATDISNYHLLPWWMAVRLAFYLPWVELVCGVAVLVFWLDRGALLILLFLTSMFVGALTIARVRGIDISCGCFGNAARNLSFASHLVLDLGIIAVVLLLLFLARSRPAT